MIYSASHLPLYVDLDGTLLKSDVLLESILALLRRNPLFLFLIPVWLVKGRANLKHELAQRVELVYELLPFNQELLSFIHEERTNGREITLISASNQKPVAAIGKHLALFDSAIGSDQHTNLRSRAKLERIREHTANGDFAYAGNSAADLAIWADAEQILLVNCKPSLIDKLLDRAQQVTQFDAPAPPLRKFVEAIRPHQWLKNGLVFLPLLLSHQLLNPELLLQALLGFISFCLCASSVYLLNDMLDLDSDRQHQSKRQRPFASGDLSLVFGFIGAPLLLIAAIVVALLLPRDFLSVLTGYWLLTCLYSFWLKRLFLLDAMTLAVLYTIRIIAGSAAIAVITTNWLLAFSACIFFGLALLKRYIELSNLVELGESSISGRAYSTSNLQAIATAGACSSLSAVVVFAFYINAPDITRLYGSPALLWLICPMLLYLLWRIWAFAHRGKLHEDPIMFAITDHQSQAISVLCLLVIWAAI